MTQQRHTSGLYVSNPATPVRLAGILVAMTIGLNALVKWIVLPLLDNFISLYVPARSGGKDFILTASEFDVLALWATVVAIVFLLVIALLAAYKRSGATVLIFMVMSIGALLYFPVLMGNSFDELFSGLWSLVGVVIAVGVIFFIQGQFLKTVISSKPSAK